MQPFTLHIPTQIRFGTGAINALGGDATQYGKTALLVFGGGSIHRNGVYDAVTGQLKSAGVKIIEYGGVSPNPLLSHAQEGARIARDAGVDFVVAAGGGSVIDESKAIAVGAADTGALWDFYSRTRTLASAAEVLPILAVQTLPASSSEINQVSVLTNDTTREKFSLRSPLTCPRIAYLDPTVTTTIPMEYTAYAVTDILSHVMEGYFTTTDPWAPVQEGMVEGLARGVVDSMNRLLADPYDMDARTTIMWAGSLAWSGLMNAGVVGASIPNHMLEHPLSAHYDIAHGAGLSVMIPAWLTYMRDHIGDRIERFGRTILRIGDRLDVVPAKQRPDVVIDALREWYRSIGTPVTFEEAGLDPDIDVCTRQALTLAELWGVTGHTEQDIRGIYRLAQIK
jgi:alcohol dehydrogenase YqhD (iron-dependent ADH family)